MSTKASASALKDLEAAIAKAADALAKDGLYIENISVNSVGRNKDYANMAIPQRWNYTREIQVRLTNKVPAYISQE
jgi:hypothetical protein